MKFIEKWKQNKLTEDMIFPFIIVSIVLILLWQFSDGIIGNDFWWHVKVGEWICENGRIPTNDIFSWYGIEKELPWTAHEWLADVIYYWILNNCGEVGIYFFCLAAALLMSFLILGQVKEQMRENMLISSIYFVFLAVVLSLFFYGRPHVFSFFLLFFELKILYSFMENPDYKAIYFIPVIGCLWSNLHGGSSNLAYLLCIVFWVVSLLNINLERMYCRRLPKPAIIRLGIISILTVLSVLINPIGVQVLTFPYSSIGDDLMMSAISEWQAPDVKAFAQLLIYFMPIVLMTVGIIAKETKVRVIDFLVMGMFLYLFLRSARFIMLWYIAATFYAFPYLPTCRLKPLEKTAEKVLLGVVWLLCCIPIGMSLCDISHIEENSYIEKVMSDEAIEAVRENQTDRMFNDYNLGEALIYNDIPVFFDARADMYLQQNIFADGISLISLNQKNSEANTLHVDVDALIKKYDFDSILILKFRPLYSYLSSHEEMVECIYEDEDLAYFKLIK